MEIRAIHTKKEHAAALAEVERLVALDPQRGTAEGDRLEVLSILVERYEKEHFPIAPPTPIEAIEFHMDRLGLRQADLVPLIGSRGRVSKAEGQRGAPVARPPIQRIVRRAQGGGANEAVREAAREEVRPLVELQKRSRA